MQHRPCFGSAANLTAARTLLLVIVIDHAEPPKGNWRRARIDSRLMRRRLIRRDENGGEKASGFREGANSSQARRFAKRRRISSLARFAACAPAGNFRGWHGFAADTRLGIFENASRSFCHSPGELPLALECSRRLRIGTGQHSGEDQHLAESDHFSRFSSLYCPGPPLHQIVPSSLETACPSLATAPSRRIRHEPSTRSVTRKRWPSERKVTG